MKKLLPVLVLGFLIFQSCRKIPVGFLQTEYAGYTPDSLIIPAVLKDTGAVKIPNPTYALLLRLGYTPAQLASTNNPLKQIVPEFSLQFEENYLRNKNKIPWVGTSIQGLKGTAPIKIEVLNIKPESPEAEKLKSLISIRGSSGIIQVPPDHGLPTGHYIVSLGFSNEGWKKEIQDVFTIIIK
ncbi:hypothetical protein ABIE26_001188 [Pedobacter africanus]|uniref:Uncharacterized protein n=1 Tax=Pedobacter africanus TaxID=151894 RepID=A0ACC6KT57_9SPHI|nr:hypothetical protein [Pedobacter africanus]MDR6782324.1 hypothetical protein [Pedobacter africanus]